MIIYMYTVDPYFNIELVPYVMLDGILFTILLRCLFD